EAAVERMALDLARRASGPRISAVEERAASDLQPSPHGARKRAAAYPADGILMRAWGHVLVDETRRVARQISDRKTIALDSNRIVALAPREHDLDVAREAPLSRLETSRARKARRANVDLEDVSGGLLRQNDEDVLIVVPARLEGEQGRSRDVANRAHGDDRLLEDALRVDIELEDLDRSEIRRRSAVEPQSARTVTCHERRAAETRAEGCPLGKRVAPDVAIGVRDASDQPSREIELVDDIVRDLDGPHASSALVALGVEDDARDRAAIGLIAFLL